MAMSKPVATDLKMITCAMCSETYKSPKILTCLHTFCEACINNFIVSVIRKVEKPVNNFTCPLCRTVVKPTDKEADVIEWAKALPANIVMEIIIAKETNGRNPDCFACRSTNEISEAKFWCNICDEALCDQCNICHSRLKVSRHHQSVIIDDIAVDNGGIYVNAIDVECKEHSKEVDHFCSDHQQFGCNFCLNLKHRECTNVKSTKDLSSEYQAIPETLKHFKESFQQMLTSKLDQKTDLHSNIKNIEKETELFVNCLKQRLDSLLEAFKKQLNIFHEEENTKINIRLRLLEEFIKDLEHWVEVTEAVRKSGNDTQLAVQVDVTKRQMNSALDKLCRTLQFDCKIALAFHENQIAKEVRTINDIGAFIPSYLDTGSPMKSIYEGCENLGIKYYPMFEDVGIKFVKHIRIVGVNLKCGVEIDQNMMIVGDVATENKYVRLINKDNGNKVHALLFEGDIRRLCYDTENKRLFISNGSKKNFVSEVQDNKLVRYKTFTFTNGLVGALAQSESHVYALTNEGIKMFDPREDTKELTECFGAKTSNGLSGLKISDGNIIFTTSSNEVKKTTMDGNELFCFTNPDMTPISLAVLPSGSILVLDDKNKGRLRILSVDGRRHRILLEKFNTVTSPRDVWIGADGKTVYVGGGQCVDIYEITRI